MQVIQADGCKRSVPVDPEQWVKRRGYVEPHAYFPTSTVEPVDAAIRLLARVSRESYWDLLPPELAPLGDAIARSKSILALEPDPDAGITEPYTQETWNRAVEFLLRHALWLWNEHHVVVQVPLIDPGPNGSIDIHWKATDYELLVNIRRDPSQGTGFYGDDHGKISIRGTLDPCAFNKGLAIWLMDKA